MGTQDIPLDPQTTNRPLLQRDMRKFSVKFVKMWSNQQHLRAHFCQIVQFCDMFVEQPNAAIR